MAKYFERNDFMEKTFEALSDVRERDFNFIKSFFTAVTAFFLALSPLFDKLSPFPAAFIGILSGFDGIFAFFGSIVGYAVSGKFDLAIPQIAAMAVIMTVRLIIGNREEKFFSLISAFSAAVSVFIACLPSSQGLSDVFIGFSFAVITFISILSAHIFSAAKDKPLTAENISLYLSGGIIYTLLITALSGLSADFFNMGIFLSAIGIVFAPYIRDGLCAPTGILSAVGLTLCNGRYSEISIILALSALVSSLLGGYGRITRACGLIFTLGGGILIAGVTRESTVCMSSVIIGGVAAMLVPEKYIPVFHNRCYAGVAASKRPFYAFGRRLEGMSFAIGEMNTAIKKTAEVLDSQNLQDPSQIYITAADEVCTGCKNNMECWGSFYNRSADILNKAVAGIRSGTLAGESALSGHFAEICTKRREFATALNKKYAAFCSAKSAARKVTEMRSVLSSQLSATERMLKKVSEELCTDDYFDEAAAELSERILKENGIKNPVVTAIYIDGRLTLDAYGYETTGFEPENISKRLSFALRKEFDPPMLAESEDRLHLTLSERTVYDAQIKFFSRSKADNAQCGDCYDCFNDGKGNVYMILSDGMGSGSRARIDSAFSCGMLSKMLKAGIDFDAAMEMLNTSLMVKSSDESFATLDVCRINLYTGDISLYKAGSASTFVRCGKSFSELSGNGIPFGVDFKADYSESSFKVGFGDVIIMASDGADIDKTWLERIVMREKSADLNGIIATIGEALRLGAEKGKEDDITVIGVKITK